MTEFIPYSRCHQRWYRFKKHRRGYISLWVLVVLFVMSLFANFIANDKPILVYYNNNFYSPLFFDYPETTFGGKLLSETNYLYPSIQQHIKKQGWMIWPLIKTRYNTSNDRIKMAFATPPSTKNWLGTTDNGSDVFTHLLYGLRFSLIFAFLLTFATTLIGTAAGIIQAYYGGHMALFGQRFMAIWFAIPQFFLIILLSSLVVAHVWWRFAILILFGWITLANVVQGELLRNRHFNYIRAAKALGVKHIKIIRNHCLPNAMIAILTFLPSLLCSNIAMLTILDFLGLGMPLDIPSLGRLLLQGKNNLQAPWLGISITAVLAILFTLLVFIGEAIRDTFDLKTQRLIP